MAHWIPKPGALRARRDELKLTVSALSKKTKGKVSESTIRRIERGFPGLITDEIVEALAEALKCRREDLADWATAPDLAPAAARSAAPDTSPRSSRDIHTHQAARVARAERAQGRHEEEEEIGGKRYPLVGFDRLRRIEANYVDLTNIRFAVKGLVRETQPIPLDTASVISAEVGRGAVYGRINRRVEGLQVTGSHQLGYDFNATVFAPSGRHGNILDQCHYKDIPVIVLVRIVVGVPSRRWPGFPIYAATPEYRPWGFITEAIIPEKNPFG